MRDRPPDHSAAADTFARARAIFEAALASAGDDRDGIVRDGCGADAPLKATVDRMLDADGAPHALLDGGPLLVADRWAPGDEFAHFRIGELVGRGGMGEVYRARDLTLDRDVALKVLPAGHPDGANDSDRSRRLQQEARTLAALSHPNIATIHGLVEADGIRALVLELVDGPTLAERLADGPMPIGEATACARQIAGALEAAHERGIVHRDLKPANVKLRPDGTVKLLDFGLATVVQAAGAASSEPAGGVAGTAAYVSPEQVRGREGHRRDDIWAFGATLYEMVTGQPAFAGRDVPDTLAAVTAGAIDWARLPATTPPPLRRLLARCLDRDVTRRLRDVGEARIVLDDVLDGTGETVSSDRVVPRRWPLAAAGVAIALAAGAGALALGPAGDAAPAPVTRFVLSLPADRPLLVDPRSRDVAIARDGSLVVYKGGPRIDRTYLFARRLDRLESEPLTPGGMPKGPFLSPDGQWVGYFEPGLPGAALKKVPITGGPPVLVSRLDGPSSGAVWIDERTIVAASGATASGLLRLPAAGGEPVVLTRPDRARGEGDHLWPHALPGGRQVLFTITSLTGGLEAAQIAVLDVATRRWRPVLPRARQPHYLPTGHLVYVAGGALWAVGFDAARAQVHGSPRVVVPQVVTLPTGVAEYDVGDDGTLVYVAGPPASAAARTLVWVDADGREEPLDAPPRAYVSVRLSPDGTRVATEIEGDGHDIWVWDLAGKRLTRVTNDPGTDQAPVWMPDGRRLVFKTEAGGVLGALAMQAADGSGALERLLEGNRVLRPSAVLADGSGVVFSDGAGPKLLRLDASRRASPVLDLAQGGGDAELSPDGRWMAYVALDAGMPQVFVSPFPAAVGRVQVTPAGGSQPKWAPDGRTLYFTSPDGTLMAVKADVAPAFRGALPSPLLARAYYGGVSVLSRTRTYDIAADGRRFLVIKDAADGTEPRPPQIVVVRNWHAEVLRAVPVAR